MNNLRILLLTLLISTLTSCSMMPPADISWQEPYKDYIGKTVYLKKDTTFWLGGEFSDDYPNEISPFNPEGKGFTKVTLQKGQPFTLEKVKRSVDSGVSRVSLWGVLTVRDKEYKIEVPHGDYPHRFETELPVTIQPN